jgi:hypothetical protein
MYKRNCPRCGKELEYNKIEGYKQAEKKKSVCKTCMRKGKKLSQISKSKISKSKKGKYCKDKNPFFGKHHTEENIKKFRENKLNNPVIFTEEVKRKHRRAGKNSGRFERSNYTIWVEKYGKNIADEKYKDWRKKLKENAPRGEKNWQFGKPATHSCGRGWSGWYKECHFRSLKELSFIILYLERFKFKWESAEKAKFKIEYINEKGEKKNYFPDFIVNNKFLIEIKPKELFNFPLMKLKTKFALDFCKKNGYIYKIIDPKSLTHKEIKELFLTGKIKFISKYELKLLEKYGKEKNYFSMASG